MTAEKKPHAMRRLASLALLMACVWGAAVAGGLYVSSIVWAVRWLWQAVGL